MASSTYDQPNQETSHNTPPCENPMPESSNTLFDLPPESFWVAKGDEHDWFDRNATIERKSSRKLRFFSTATHHQAKPVLTGSVFSPTQKVVNTSLIGFPTGQKSALPNGNQRQNKAGNKYLFRSRSEPGGKPTLQVTEPASPQVSCLGRIGTKRERANKTGVWRSIVTMLRFRFKMQRMAHTDISKPEKTKERSGPIEPESNAASLAGLKRVESAKKSETSTNFEG